MPPWYQVAHVETIAHDATLSGMSTPRIRIIAAAASVVAFAALTACASLPGSAPAPTSGVLPTAAPPAGQVTAAGTVIDDGDQAQLCVFAVMESYPPQCSGVPLDGWNWDVADGSETSGTITWGGYAVSGTFDGERFTMTDPPIPLALYDPIAPEDPTRGEDGTTSDAELQRIQDELSDRLGADMSVSTARGYVWVGVLWDDGTLQDALDGAYGGGVVIVTSALREVD